MIDVNDLHAMVRTEIQARSEEGCDVSLVVRQMEGLEETRSGSANLEGLLEVLGELEPDPEYPFDEPSGLEAIRAARPGNRPGPFPVTGDLRNRILGAWLGRCAGCLLGKPVELLTRDEIIVYLKAAGEYPLARYFPLLDVNPLERPLHRSARESTRGHFDCMRCRRRCGRI